MLDELRSLRDAHAKLQLEMDSDQGRHRRDLDSLTAQVASFRKAQSESSDLIKKLETKNADLTARLARSAKQLKQRSVRNQNLDNSITGNNSGGGGVEDETVTSIFSRSAKVRTLGLREAAKALLLVAAPVVVA